MKNAFKSIRRMKAMAFLIILQLSIGLMMLNSTATMVEMANKKIEGLSNIVNFEKTILMRSKAKYGDKWFFDTKYSFEQYKDIQKVYDKLEELKEKNIIKRNCITFSPRINLIVGLDKHLPEKYSNLDPMQRDTYSATVRVNEDFAENYNFDIYKGRSFTKEDFNLDYKKDIIPIIIGRDYEKSVNLGDTFEIKERFWYEYIPIDEFEPKKMEELKANELYEEIIKADTKVIDGKTYICDTTFETFKVKVVGYYENQSMPILDSKINVMQNVIYSDAASIIPCIKNFPICSELVVIQGFGALVEFDDLSKVNIVKEALAPILEEGELELEATPLSEDYLRIKEA